MALEKLLEAMILRSKGLIRCAVISDETGLPLAGTKGCEKYRSPGWNLLSAAFL